MEASLKTIFFSLALAPALIQAKVTYDDQVLSIFEQACLNCHNPDKNKGGLDLSTYAATLKGGSGGKVVEAQDSSSSLLAVVKHASEPKMPPEGDALAKDQISVLEAWVEGGLLENTSSKARKPAKPKFDVAVKTDPSAEPEGPPPMPEHLLLEPVLVAPRSTAVHAVASSPWAPLLAVTGQRQVLLHHTGHFGLLGILPFPEGDPVSLAFTPDGRYLIVGGGTHGKSGTTVTFDVTTGERMLSAGREFDTVIAADLHPSLGKVATGSPSRLIKVWKTEDGSSEASIKKHTDWITALDYSPDGILLGTGDRNGGVWVWESESANEFHTLRGHQAGITALAFRPDSNVMATASEDGSVRFWEMNQGKEIKKIDAHPGGVLAFGWARDGSFATAGRNKKVRIWKPDFGQRREIKDLPDIPTAVALDAEGKRVFIADYRGIITVHDVAKGDKLGQFNANPPSIATRLAKVGKSIEDHPKLVAVAKQKHQQESQKLTKHEQHIATLQQSEKEAKESAKSAERQLAELKKNQPKDPKAEAAARTRLENSRKRSSDIAKKISKERETLNGMREAVDKSATELKQQRSSMANLERQRNRWQAADLNARSMILTKKAKELSVAVDAAAEEFTEAAREVESFRAALTAKRQELAAASLKVENAESSLKEELESVAKALKSVIKQRALELEQSEARLLQLGRRLDQQLPEIAETRAESARLKAAYLAKLKPAP